MSDDKVIVSPVVSMQYPDILGEYVDVHGEIVQFLSPFTGEEIEEGILRVIRANLDSFGWIWINGETVTDYPEDAGVAPSILDDEYPVDLNTLKVSGSWVVTSYSNYVPGINHTPINIFTEYMDDVLFMITLVGTDIYYRVYMNELDEWTEWIHQSFCEILTSDTPPEEYEPNDLWLQPPTPERANYVLYANVNDVWMDITGNRVMYIDDYDPEHLQRNVYEYISTMIRKKLSGLTDVDALKIPSLYLSENYTRIAYTVMTEQYLYFFINPEDIKVNMILDQDHVAIIQYTVNGEDPTLIIGPATNFRYFAHSADGRFYGIGTTGQIYESTNLTDWDIIENFIPRKDLSTLYEAPIVYEVNAKEIESVYEYGEITFMKKCETGKIYFFTSSGDFFVEEHDHNFTLYRDIEIPRDFAIQDITIYHKNIYAIGYLSDGTADTAYYKSYDDGQHWFKYDLPVPRNWSILYTFEDILVISTDVEETEMLPQTYCTKFHEDGIDIWELYEHAFGGCNVSDTDYLPIDIHIDMDTGNVIISITNDDNTLTAATNYDYLTRYLYEELNIYTYDQIKELVMNAMKSYYQIEFYEYGDRVDLDSFGSIRDGFYGFNFYNDDGTLGLQTIYYATYTEGLKNHMVNEEVHLTEEDRALMLGFIPRADFNEIHDAYQERLEEHVSEELEKLVFTDEFINASNQVEEYLEHKADTLIHVNPELREIYNSKAQGNHTHFLDNRVELKTDDIEGILPFDTIPPEAVKRMIKVPSIQAMLALNKYRDGVQVGSCIRVMQSISKFSDLEDMTYAEMEKYTWGRLEARTQDPNEVLLGRFFWVLDNNHLNLFSSYLEFTMTDTVCVYWDEILNRPTSKEGLNITDVPTTDELELELTYHDKSAYGFEFLAADSTEAKLVQQIQVESANEILESFQIDNPPQNLADNLTDMVLYMDNNPDSIQRLNFGEMPMYTPVEQNFVYITDFQYSPITERYYVYSAGIHSRHQIVTIYDKDFNFLNVKAYSDTSRRYIKYRVFGIYRYIEWWINDSIDTSYLYNTKLKTTTAMAEGITIQNSNAVIPILHVDQATKPYVFINTNFQLGIIKFTDDMKYDYRIFNTPLTSINPVNRVMSMYYNVTDDALIVTCMNSPSGAAYTYRYTGLSVLVKSFDYFAEIDEYINNEGVDNTLTFVGDIPSREDVVFTSNYTVIRYYGKWDEKHIFIVRRDSDHSFYLAISDDFYSIPYVTVYITDAYIDDVSLNIDIIPYMGKTYAICYQNLIRNEFLKAYQSSTNNVNDYMDYNVGASTHMYKSDKVIFIDIDTLAITTNDDRTDISKKSIPHVNDARGIRYCNGCMYLYGGSYTLIEFSPKAFFNINEVEERIHIVACYPSNTIWTYDHLDRLPIDISESNNYNGPIYNFAGSFAVNIESINNIRKHTIANTAIEYQIYYSHPYPMCISRVSTDGVVIGTLCVPYRIGYASLAIDYYSDSKTFQLLLSVDIRSTAPYCNGATVHPCDVYGAKINNVLYFTFVFLDRLVNQLRIYYITEDGAFTTETRDLSLDYTATIEEDYRKMTVSFKRIKGYLMVSPAHGMYEIFKINVNGTIGAAPILTQSTPTYQQITGTGCSVLFPSNKYPYEESEDAVAYPNDTQSTDPNIIGYVYKPTVNDSETGLVLTPICPIPIYVQENIGSNFAMRILHLPYTRDIYRSICVAWDGSNLDPVKKMYLSAADDPSNYEIIDTSLFSSIRNINYILASNSLVGEENYGFVIIEASIAGENGAIDYTTETGETVTLRKTPYGIFYIPVSTSAILDIFRSNFAQLQKSSSSVYSKIENVISDLEELF